MRWAAAAVVWLWVMAVAHCTADCMSDGACSGSERANPAAAVHSSRHPSNPSGRHDDCFCDSLHSVCPVLPGAALARPDFGLAASSNVHFTAPLAGLTLPGALIRRQPPDRQRVFTPEVCLGPAFHSLAPPVSVPG